MGFGLIEAIGQKITLIELDILILEKIKDPNLKLKKIYEKTSFLIETYKPNELAIEAPFFGKNVQSMLKLGRAQGVAMAATLVKDLPIVEYAPRKIKQSLTGKGSASKEQVAQMIKNLLKLNSLPKELDASDGIAVAICHYYQKNHKQENTYSGWDAYLKANPKKGT